MTFYEFARWLSTGFTSLFYDVKYEGLENIPEEGGYIIASNHRSFFDPFLLAIKVKQQLFFMAKAEIFKWPVIGLLVKWVGAFPVERGKGDTGAVEWAANLLREGKLLAIFPEGTRSKDGKPLKPKSGAALIARMTKADILPCAICFEGRLSFRKRITVKFGEIIKHESLGYDEGTASSLKRASKIIFGAILRLLGVEADEN